VKQKSYTQGVIAMNENLRVLVLGNGKVTEIPLSALTPIGGTESSGINIEDSKFQGDYAILAPSQNGISLHPLRGDTSRPVSLQPGQSFRIEDLTVFVDRSSKQTTDSDGDELSKFDAILVKMSEPKNTLSPLEDILNLAMKSAGHDQGLVISQNISGEYETIAAKNLDANQPWLSESVVLQAIKDKKPILLQNVIGSGFDTKKSLVATGFLSVFCWPLVVQGNTLGVLVTGSRRPHSGFDTTSEKRILSYTHLAAMVLNFHLRELRLKAEINSIRIHQSERPFLTENAALIEICELGRKVANSDLSILIQGETGVGKEVLSKWIHNQSDRKSHPFIAVNCGAIPHDLLESILFGHKRGSFTGAFSDQIGKIQQAHGGTLFLDEIGDLPHSLQAKLLRVLQERSVEPVGSTKPVLVNIRVVCASHKNIKKLVTDGLFREDLYYRLAQVTLLIPSLRERPSDIRLLTHQFLKEINPAKILSEEAWSWMFGQPWNGNVRELKSSVERATLLSPSSEIRPQDFMLGSGEAISATRSSEEKGWLGAVDLETAKRNFVKNKLLLALDMTSGNRTKAAELLGVTPRTLFRYLE
jgi:two-component system NtrC family response regulator